MQVNDDHVLPRALRGPPPKSQAWSPILDVHKSCHKRKNLAGEEVAALLHKIKTLPPSQWPPQIKSLRLKPIRVFNPLTAETEYALAGVESIRQAAWAWVRGMHSLVYRQFLPDINPRIMFAPGPEIRATKILAPPGDAFYGAAVAEQVEAKEAILTGLGAAYRARAFDGIRAWGGNCEYVSVWVQQPDTDGMAICLWALNFSGLLSYADGTRWRWTPWCGMLKVIEPPEPRQLWNQEAVNQYQAELQQKLGRSTLPLR